MPVLTSTPPHYSVAMRYVVVLMVAWCAVARAEAVLRLDVVPKVPFPKGMWTLEIEGSYTAPIRFSTDEFATGTVGVGYYLFDNFSVTALGHGFHVNQEAQNDTDGGGASLLLRWHLLNLDRFSFYLDGGGGLVWTQDPVPTGGTTYNYTARAGGGISWRLKEDVYLLGGARYFHLSNGNQHGRENNPSFDGVEYYIGLMFAFR